MDNHLDNELELLEQRQIEQKARREKSKIPIQSTPVPSLISQILPTQKVENNSKASNYDYTEVEKNDILFPFEYSPSDINENNVNCTVPTYNNNKGIGYSNINFQIKCNNESDVLPIENSTDAAKRQSPRKFNITSSSANTFAGLNYEIVNDLLHNKYPLASKGVLSLTKFNFKGARKDLSSLLCLKIGDIIDDPNLTMIGLWVKKLQAAIKSEDEDDSGSDCFN